MPGTSLDHAWIMTNTGSHVRRDEEFKGENISTSGLCSMYLQYNSKVDLITHTRARSHTHKPSGWPLKQHISCCCPTEQVIKATNEGDTLIPAAIGLKGSHDMFKTSLTHLNIVSNTKYTPT